MLVWLILLGVVFVVVVMVADVHFTTRRLLRYLRTVDLGLRPQERPLQGNASAAIAALEAAGYEPEARGVIGGPSRSHSTTSSDDGRPPSARTPSATPQASV